MSCRNPRKMERQIDRMISVDLRLKNYTAQWSMGVKGGGMLEGDNTPKNLC